MVDANARESGGRSAATARVVIYHSITRLENRRQANQVLTSIVRRKRVACVYEDPFGDRNS